jgi:hypothetical protein
MWLQVTVVVPFEVMIGDRRPRSSHPVIGASALPDTLTQYGKASIREIGNMGIMTPMGLSSQLTIAD